jgi:hypothetical protein
MGMRNRGVKGPLSSPEQLRCFCVIPGSDAGSPEPGIQNSLRRGLDSGFALMRAPE